MVDPKVTAAGVAGAAAVIVIYVVEVTTGLDIPAYVAAAATTVLAFAAGFIKSS